MHQTRHGHFGVDCDISCLLQGEDPGSQGLISAQAPYHFITLALGLDILPDMSRILKHLLGHGLRQLSQHLESDQSVNVNKCDKAEIGLFRLLFVLLFRV